jgi:ATP-dependent Lon protease
MTKNLILIPLPPRLVILPGALVRLSSRDVHNKVFDLIVNEFSSPERDKDADSVTAVLVWPSSKRAVEGQHSDGIREYRRVCLTCKVIEVKVRGGGVRECVLQATQRAFLLEVTESNKFECLMGKVSICVEESSDENMNLPLIQDIAEKMKILFGQAAVGDKKGIDYVEKTLRSSSPSIVSDVLGSLLIKDQEKRRQLLETIDVRKRLEMVLQIVDGMVKSLDAGQRDVGPMDKCLNTAKKNNAPSEILEIIEREIEKTKKMPENHPGYSIQLNYLDWLSSLPWNVFDEKMQKEPMSLEQVEERLNERHYGMSDVKKRIIEYVAVRRLQGNATRHMAPILCLVGAPGTGKTSIASSIAACMNKKFQRISLGGVRDEAEIRGHRRTYIGAMPGKVLSAMKKASVSDPVILIDEVDKTSVDTRGDPASALLELFDPEQNKGFVDHYLGVPFDMSRVTFVTTANTVDSIPGPLLDRMEVIQLSGYTLNEKYMIASKYLLPKLKADNGVQDLDIVISRNGLEKIIDLYTREAGVRKLSKCLDSICRHCAVQFVKQGNVGKWKIDEKDVESILGPPLFERVEDSLGHLENPGTAAGLVWTPVGGSVQYIECLKIRSNDRNSGPDHARLVLTGRMGEVLNESAHIALSWIRGNLQKLAGHCDDPDSMTIHIHLPAGAIRKDGPSAGITILVALVSLLTHQSTGIDIALTGEISLHGNVLPVGGIKEKLIAAHTAGFKRVIIPYRNFKEAEKYVAEERLDGLKLFPITRVEQALEHVFDTHLLSETTYISKM